MIVSGQTVKRLLQSRTAFPTDLSIGELFDRGLIVESRFGRVGTDETVKAAELSAILASGNVLLLGEPGSGKSVAALEVLRGLDTEMLAADLSSAFETAPETRPSETSADSGRRSAVLVDGVDEYIARGKTPEAVSRALSSLSDAGPILVACRNAEYLRLLASQMPRDFFQAIFVIRPWRVDVEFEAYIAKLVEAALLDSPFIVRRVRASGALTEIVSRPLLARMLTFLAGEDDLPRDDVDLYGRYFSHLSAVVDGQEVDSSPRSAAAVSIWKQACWAEYQAQGRGSARFSVRDLVAHARKAGISNELIFRKLSAILNVRAYEDDATFVHYTFFEYLVASKFVETLTTSDRLRGAGIVQHLQVDFTISVRRFVVALLKRSRLRPSSVRKRLLSAYRAADRLPLPQRLTARNLVMYLLCRVDGVKSSEIAELLHDEPDPFLRNSIWWALARSGDTAGADGYLLELEASRQLSESNRGYLLYYYGDISVSAEPPFRDSPPYVDWSNTRRALNEKYQSDEYQRIAPARRSVDLYTYMDLVRVRGDALEPEEIRMLDRMLTELRAILPDRPATETVESVAAMLFGTKSTS